MKKTLLTTTAILGALASTGAQAGNLQVNVGGFVDFQAGYVSDDIVGDSQGGGLANNNETNFNTDAEIHFIVEGTADNGLEYGAVVELEADVGATTDTDAAGNNADKAYVYLQGGWGRVELGENTGAEAALSVNTASFASATGGVDGDWYRYAAAPTGGGTNGFITEPDLVLANGGTASAVGEGADEDATKITYYSPRFSGFQVGVSYIPNSGDTVRQGGAVAATADNEDVFTGGINFTEQFDEIGVAASVTGLKGDDKTPGGNADLEGYAAGVNLTFAGFTAGGSYGEWEDVFGTGVDAEYFDLGLGYAAGPWSVSATYLNSEVDAAGTVADEFDNLVVGADYQLAPGLVPYAEVSFFEYDSAGTGVANDNEGTVFILGTELTF